MTGRAATLAALLTAAAFATGGSADATSPAKGADGITSEYPADPLVDAAAGGPDIAGIYAAAAPGGKLRFDIVLLTPARLGDNDWLFLEINSDASARTGGTFAAPDQGKHGIDYIVEEKGLKYGFFRLTSSANGKPQSHTLSVKGVHTAFKSHTWTVTIDRSLLGNPRTLEFYVETDEGPVGGATLSDLAPDLGSGTFVFPEPATKNGAADAAGVVFRTKQTTLVAGKTSHVIVDAEKKTGAPVTTFGCQAWLASGRRIQNNAGLNVSDGHTLDCPIKVPRSAKGQTISVHFTISGTAVLAGKLFSSNWMAYLRVH